MNNKPLLVLYPNHVTDLELAVETVKKVNFDRIVIEISNTTAFKQRTPNHQQFTKCDLLLKSGDWRNKVILKLSSAIDCDSLDESTQKNSEKQLHLEIAWSKHLNHNACILVQLLNDQSDNLSLELMTYLDRKDIALLQLPIIDKEIFVKQKNRNGNELDKRTASTKAWKRWNSFFLNVMMGKNYKIALELTPELPDAMQLKRWFSEPVELIIIPSDSLLRSKNGDRMSLKPEILEICLEFMKRNVVHFAIQCNSLDLEYANDYLRCFENDFGKDLIYDCNVPIATAARNRDELNGKQCDYFMMAMWDTYKAAIQLAVNDRAKNNEKVNVLICGTNGYQLLTSIWHMIHGSNAINVFIYEENAYIRKDIFDNIEDSSDIVLIAHTDVTEYHGKMDIIVAVSPELMYQSQWLKLNMDHVSKYATIDAIFIPKQTKLFISPVMSSRIQSEIQAETYAYVHRNPTDCREGELRKQTIRSSFMRHICQCSVELEAFKFEYPMDTFSQERHKQLQFHIEQDYTLTGFAGYFEANLYKDIKLNGCGGNDGGRSCIPIMYFPLIHPTSLDGGCELNTEFWLVFNKAKHTFWYEWCMKPPHITPIYNLKGASGCFDYKHFIH